MCPNTSLGLNFFTYKMKITNGVTLEVYVKIT